MFKFRLLSLLLFALNTKCEPNWTFDLIAVEIENNTPDIVYIEGEVTRPRRGVFGLTATIDLKEDITDQTFFQEVTFYSPTGTNFARTAYAIPKSNLSTLLNRYYKVFVMESILKCSENAPRIVDRFVAPLTKRVIHLKDCVVSNENMPLILRSGYYKIKFWYSNFAEGSVEFLIQVEQNN